VSSHKLPWWFAVWARDNVTILLLPKLLQGQSGPLQRSCVCAV